MSKLVCPKTLKGEALAEWKRIVPRLKSMEYISKEDQKSLEAYCIAYAKWKEAEMKITEEGMTMTTPNGYIQQTPYVNIALQNLRILLSIGREFGMTPASRARINGTAFLL